MSISFNNIPSDVRTPLFYAEVDNSMANSAASAQTTLLIGQMTEGKADPLVPVLVTGDSQGKDLFGRGSELARMNTIYRKNDPSGQVWAIPLSDPDAATVASGTYTISGLPTLAGVLSIYIGADRVQVPVGVDESPAEVAASIASVINGKPDLPVTAEASASQEGAAVEEGYVTVSTKNKGANGNDIALGLNIQGYGAGEETPEGLSVKITAMAGGTGSPDFAELDLAQIMGDDQYDFILMPYCDTVSLQYFQEVMGDTSGRWAPDKQQYGHVYTCKRDTISELQKFGVGRNDQHMTIIGIEPDVPSLSIEVLAAYGAQNAAKISIDPARPTQTLELIGITSAPHGKRFTMSERQVLLTNGIATEYTESGYMRVERAITTYQKNRFGEEDNSYLDSETLHTLAYIIRSLRSCITSKYPRHKLASDGTRFGAGQAVVTPSIIRGELIAMYTKLEEKAIVENADLFAKYLIVERNKNDPNRIDVLLPPDLVNQLRVFAVLAQFRLQFDE
ncbi:phage tail sheath C-terminal domain-containing protein [Turicimonas muris]